ncbi:glutamate receptor ionotropic, delta-2-like [Amphibalanus amphitrite]|uniref:glutamate receptor ionotropic, delta-2-like n=1 Tax=Amphibalanus amphitrite TaxID=1232801 RepID=UPI001C8FF094|nr:glutamate receptor ionotropic, delta-2-like [Amphibalanus amphitrite]
MLGLLMYTAYSATLVSFLAAADRPRPAFSDLTGLLHLPHWKAGWKDGDLLENFLDWCRLVQSPLQDCDTLQQVYEKHVLPERERNLVDSYEEGFRKVAEGNYAFLASNEAADYYLSKIDPHIACHVHKLDVSYSPGGIALGLQKHSPYRELFNHGIQMLGEGGVLEKLYRKALESSLICNTETIVEASLLHTMGAFAVLLLGVTASLLVLTVEWAAFRCAVRVRLSRASHLAGDQLRALSRQLSNGATWHETRVAHPAPHHPSH